MKGFMIVLTGVSVLCVTGCSTQRRAEMRESRDLRTTELRSMEARDSVRLELRDTVMETKTITITKNSDGDTIMQSIVCERERVRNRDRVRDNHERKMIKTDTVFVERRDSVLVKNGKNQSGSAALHSTVKWVFFIILALIALRMCPFFRRE